jgi:hypothetical protein
MADTPQTPNSEATSSTRWKRASLVLTLLALFAIVGPIAANVMLTREGESTRKHEKREEKSETSDEQEEEEEEDPSSSRSVFSSFSGGGSRSGGSRSTSSSDVVACNRAATAARKRSAPPQHQGLAKALDAAGGGLLGATAQSLHGVEQQVADDQRAADAFRACMDAAR